MTYLAAVLIRDDQGSALAQLWFERAQLTTSLKEAGYQLRRALSESDMLELLAAIPQAGILTDGIQSARSALAEEGCVFAVSHQTDASQARWIRLRELKDRTWRASCQEIADSQLAAELWLIAQHRAQGRRDWQLILDEEDALAALADRRWGSDRDPFHPIYQMRRHCAEQGISLCLAAQRRKKASCHGWLCALRPEDLPPAPAGAPSKVSSLRLNLTPQALPAHSQTHRSNKAEYARRLAEGLQGFLQQQLVDGRGLSPSSALSTLLSVMAVGHYLGIDTRLMEWRPLTRNWLDGLSLPAGEDHRQAIRSFLAALAQYMGPQAAIAQKRVWFIPLSAVEHLQDLLQEQSLRQEGLGMSESVGHLAMQAGVAPSTAREMLLEKGPESFDRLEHLLNAQGYTLQLRRLETGEWST